MYTPNPHTFLCGSSGTGKSQYLLRNIEQDKNGWLLIDPHGDLARAAAPYADLVFDPDNATEKFNPLERKADTERIVNDVVDAFREAFGDAFRDRSEEVLRNALFATAHLRRWNLAVADRFLRDEDYRHSVLAKCPDERVVGFFVELDQKSNSRFRTEVFGPILNKLGKFLLPSMRDRLTRSTFEFGEAMSKSRRVVLNLDIAILGRFNAKVWGNLILSKHFTAATMRKRRHPFTVYVDEFSFFDSDWVQKLAMARKYGIRYVVATQDITTLKWDADAIASNCGDQVAFRCGHKSAVFMAEQFGADPEGGSNRPRAQNIMDLANLEYYRRTLSMKNGKVKPTMDYAGQPYTVPLWKTQV
jgi:type IV secretory pathway TraG/TraD family ATPase VirD4